MLKSKTNLAREGVGYLTPNRSEKKIIRFVAKNSAQFPTTIKHNIFYRNGLPA
jgi:hypothetical protein